MKINHLLVIFLLFATESCQGMIRQLRQSALSTQLLNRTLPATSQALPRTMRIPIKNPTEVEERFQDPHLAYRVMPLSKFTKREMFKNGLMWGAGASILGLAGGSGYLGCAELTPTLEAIGTILGGSATGGFLLGNWCGRRLARKSSIEAKFNNAQESLFNNIDCNVSRVAHDHKNNSCHLKLGLDALRPGNIHARVKGVKDLSIVYQNLQTTNYNFEHLISELKYYKGPNEYAPEIRHRSLHHLATNKDYSSSILTAMENIKNSPDWEGRVMTYQFYKIAKKAIKAAKEALKAREAAQKSQQQEKK